jgi:hypothetical protein
VPRNLVRTMEGRMIHRADCHMANRRNSHAMPWLWADRVTPVELRNAILSFGYRRCKRCTPCFELFVPPLRHELTVNP